MPYTIEIQNTVPRYKISLSRLKKVSVQILKILGWKQAGISIQLVSDRKIRPMNKHYLKHDRPTDILSFSYAPFQGDLVISLDTTARQAREYGNTFFYELCFYICHGILHLMGHEDSTVKKAKWMEKKQTTILKKIGIQNGHPKITRDCC